MGYEKFTYSLSRDLINFSQFITLTKLHFQISGTIIASGSPETWKGLDSSQWIAFKDVTGLNIYGSGIIDGQGIRWWDQSCRYHPNQVFPSTHKSKSYEGANCGKFYIYHITNFSLCLLKGCTKLAPTVNMTYLSVFT